MIRRSINFIIPRLTSWSSSEQLFLILVAALAAGAAYFVLVANYEKAAVGMVLLLLAGVFFSVFTARRVRIASALELQKLDQVAGERASAVSPGITVLPVRFGCHADYIKIARLRDKDVSLDATIVRTGSVHARDLLAYQASKGALNFEQVRLLCEGYSDKSRRPKLVQVARSLNPSWLMRLARLLAVQGIEHDDRKNALSLYRMVYETQRLEVFDHPRYQELGATVFQQQHAKLYFDLALDDGQFDLARRLAATLPSRPVDKPFIESDLANPVVAGGVVTDQWLSLFNKTFLDADLEPVELADGEGLPLMDRLTCNGGVGPEPTVKVTVIITSWCPTPALLTAVRSIIAQTWRNLEIIIVDDASPDEYSTILESCAALDERISLLKQSKNGGTYVARNRALELATGDFVTFQDDDDWSHPRRIEKQLAPMLSDESIVSTTSQALRCNENMVFSHVGYAPRRKNASSLTFRRSVVMERIGYMDSVRKAADSEYALRILTCFGKEACVDLPTPLAVIRMRTDSLSRAEFKPGWHHPARESYRDAYQNWHKRILTGEASPYRENALEPRPFPAPTRFLVDKLGARALARQHYDFVFAGDWRRYGGPQRSMIEEIRALTSAGFKVGILHLEAFRFMIRRMRYLCEPLHELLAAGVVDELIVTDEATVDVLVLRYPPILQFLPAGRTSLNIGLFMVVANQAPHENDGSDLRYEVGTCTRNARQLFGLDPIWVPQGDSVRLQIAPLLPAGLLYQENMPGIIDIAEWAVERLTPRSCQPVIGRYSRDNYLKFPESRSKLLKAYPVSSEIDVRIMGGDMACKKFLKRRANFPENWTVSEYGAIPVQQFLGEIDFFVYFDHPNMVEAFGRSLLEALASGCVVITDKKFEAVFGEAAIYCKPEDVESVVLNLYSDWDLYSRQSQMAVDLVRRKFSHEFYVERMGALRGTVVRG